MMIFAIGIEHALDVLVQRLQHADLHMQQGAMSLGCHDEATDRRLLTLIVLLGLREPGDVFGGVLQRDKLATARQHDRIVEFPIPTHRYGGLIGPTPTMASMRRFRRFERSAVSIQSMQLYCRMSKWSFARSSFRQVQKTGNPRPMANPASK
jgi:hypothetical protein